MTPAELELRTEVTLLRRALTDHANRLTALQAANEAHDAPHYGHLAGRPGGQPDTDRAWATPRGGTAC